MILAQTELHMYGSSRIGIYNVNIDVTNTAIISPTTIFTRGNKFFELSNHLGNVLVTVSDKKLQHSNNSSNDYYLADVVTANDYYPFGMAMPGRQYTQANSGYRYGFNGKENDKDISAGGQDYGMRISDNRLGRFLSVDPLIPKYPELTPYQFASNRPIDGIDLDGAEYMTSGKFYSAPEGKWRVNTSAKMTITNFSTIITDVKTIEAIKTSLKNNIEKDQSGGIGTKEDPIVTTKVVEVTNATLKINLVDAKTDPDGSVITGYTYNDIGKTQNNKTDVSITIDGKPRDLEGVNRTASHEQGHVTGLKHPFHGAPQTDIGTPFLIGPLPNWKNNLMNSYGGSLTPGTSDYNPIPSTKGHVLTPQQRTTITQTIEAQQPKNKPKGQPLKAIDIKAPQKKKI